jgi:hypothetical protein
MPPEDTVESMSSNLYWEPVVPKGGKILSDECKFFLRKLFHEPLNHEITMKEADLLRGAEAIASPGLKKELDILIRAIERHGAIKVEERY